MSKKKFEELDLMDNFLVLALASDLEGGPAYGRLLAEGLLHEKVAHVRVHAEKIIPGSDEIGRGIRMDVEMQSFSHKPEENELPDKVYDFEPHHKNADNLFKRSRFNQAKIDAQNLYSGERDFNKLPDLCVINILDYDPFGKGQTQYHFHNMCEEDTTIPYPDGLDFYYFITTAPDGEDSELDALLKYIANSREENATTDLTKQLHKYVTKVKTSPEERYRYMTWGEYIDYETKEAKEEARIVGHAEGHAEGLAEGHAEGRAESKREDIISILEEIGEVPDMVKEKLDEISDLSILRNLLKKAAVARSMDDFIKELHE